MPRNRWVSAAQERVMRFRANKVHKVKEAQKVRESLTRHRPRHIFSQLPTTTHRPTHQKTDPAKISCCASEDPLE